MAVPFYDNLEATPIDGLTCLVEVERIYRLDWDRFDDDLWRGLARIYEGLPGARGGLTAATIGAGTATAFFAVLGTLWFVLPAVLAVVFTVVFFWVGGSRRSSTHRRVMRTRG